MQCPHCGTNNRDSAKYCLGCGGKLGESKPAAKKIKFSTPQKIKKKRASSPQIIQKGRYLVIQKLGSGGMSRIYLARDTKMDFNVVVKEMSPPQNYPEKAKYFLKKFKNEAKMLYRLRHRGIPRVTDYFAESGKYYMVMEYIEGENLDNILKNRANKQITLEEMFNWMGKILEILKFLHNQNPPIFHRDIKPANFMLNSAGDVFLVDFGVAKAIIPDEAHTAIGTIGYASPEHYTGKFIKSSDLYSLGASFHYLFTGDNPRYRTPFDFPTLSSYHKDVPKDIDEIFVKLLDKDPKKRFQSVEELIEVFSKAKRKYFDLKEKKSAPVYPSEAKIPAEEEEIKTTEDGIPPPRKTNRLELPPIMKKSRRSSKQGARRKLKAPKALFDKKISMSITPAKEMETPEQGIKDDDTVVDLGHVRIKELEKASGEGEHVKEKEVDNKARGRHQEVTSPVKQKEQGKPEIISEITEEEAIVTPPQKETRISPTEEEKEKIKESLPTIGIGSSRVKAGRDKKTHPVSTTPKSTVSAPQKRKSKIGDEIPSRKFKPSTPSARKSASKVDKRDLPERPGQKRLAKPTSKKIPEAEMGGIGKDQPPTRTDLPKTTNGSVVRVSAIEEFDEFSDVSPAAKIWDNIKKNKILIILIFLSVILLVGGIFYVVIKNKKPEKPEPSPTRIQLKPELETLLQKSRRENALGNTSKAIKLYSNLIEKKDDFAEAYVERGIIYFNEGNFNKAYEDFEKTISLDPKNTEAHFFKGRIEIKKERYDDAYKELSASINLEKDNLDAYYYRGITLQKKKDYSGAIKDFEFIKQKDSNYKGLNKRLAQSYHIKGKEDLKKGKYAEAISGFKEALKASPGKKGIINGLIKAYTHSGEKKLKDKDYKSAIEDYNALLALDKGNKEAENKLLEAYIARGNQRLNTKDHQGAIVDFNTVLEKDPDNIQALTARAKAYSSRNKNEKAIADLKKVLSVDPKNKKAKKELIRALYEQGMKYEQEEKYKKAILAYGNIINLDSKAIEAYRLRGEVYSNMGQLNRAIRDFKSALGIDPEHIKTRQSLSKTLVKRAKKSAKSGNLNSAVSDIKTALKLEPDNNAIKKDYSEIMTKMGETLLANKDPLGAIRAFSKALKLDKQNKNALANRGRAYLLINKTDSALKDCNKAIALDSAFTFAYLARGDVYFKKKDILKALNDWEKVIKLSPGSDLAKQARKRLSALPADVVTPGR